MVGGLEKLTIQPECHKVSIYRYIYGTRKRAPTHEGINKDSEGLVKEDLKDPGFHLNLKVIRTQFTKKSTILNRKMMTPIIRSHWD